MRKQVQAVAREGRAGAPPAARARTAAPYPLHAEMLRNQRTLGNRAVQRLMDGMTAPAAPAQGASQAPGEPPAQLSAGRAPAIAPAATIAPVERSISRDPDGDRNQRGDHWYNFNIPGTNYRFDPSWEGIKTAPGVVKDTADTAFDWIADEIKQLVSGGMDWLTDHGHALEATAENLWEAAKHAFANVVQLIKAPFTPLVHALSSLDAKAVRAAWASFAALLGKVSDGFKATAEAVLAPIEKGWATISGFATGLFARLDGLIGSFVFQRLPSALQSVAHRLAEKLKRLWRDISDAIAAILEKIRRWVDQAIDAVLGFVRKILSFAIDTVIAGILEFAEIVRFLADFAAHPRKYVELLAKRTVDAFSGVEALFAMQVSGHLGGGSSGDRAASPHVQREPASDAKDSAGWSEIGADVGDMMHLKWEAFKADPMSVILQLLLDLVLPVVGNVKDVIHLFDEIKKIVTSPLGADSLEAFWTSFLRILDIPILIYHTVVSIVMRSLTLPLIVASFVRHPLVTAAATAVGYVLLGAFISAEQLNLAQKLLLLRTGALTPDQKKESYNRIADSLIAFAMALAMALFMIILHFLANVARGIYAFVRAKVIEPPRLPIEAKGTAPAEGKGALPDDAKTGEVADGAKPSPAEQKAFGEWENRLNAETREMLDGDPALAEVYAEMDPTVRDLLTQCGSACIPRTATPTLAARIKGLLSRLQIRPGTEVFEYLREYLHRPKHRENLGPVLDERQDPDAEGSAILDRGLHNGLREGAWYRCRTPARRAVGSHQRGWHEGGRIRHPAARRGTRHQELLPIAPWRPGGMGEGTDQRL